MALLALAAGRSLAQADRTCGGVGEATDQHLFEDCELLLSVKDTLRGSATLNWDVATAIADWDGVTVATANGSRRVTGLQLYGAGLTGTVPASLGSLSQMAALDLGRNRLTGSIPSSLGSLASLENLKLSRNDLTGTIPSTLGSQPALEWLQIQENELEGEIPEGLKDISGMEYVDLSDNRLTGRVPREWATTSSGVAGLRFDHNRLSGCIPSGLVDNADDFVVLSFNPQQDENGDDVNLPTCVEDATLSALAVSPGGLNETFVPGDTDYTATVSPPTTGVTLTATPNDEGAEVTSVTGAAADGVTALTVTAGSGGWTVSGMTLGDNVISIVVSADDLSTETYTVTVLQTWCGRAGATDTALIADCLTLLSFEDALRGTAALNWDVATAIADWDGVTVGRAGGNPNQPKGVTELDLGGDSLTGTIPAALGDLSTLTTLRLEDNGLTGAVPAELGSLSTLEVLRLEDNSLTGAIPAELGDLSNLTTLRLEGNGLTGAIPAELGDLSNLEILRLQDNGLTGGIPAELGDLSNLTVLFLENNDLTGPIPDSLHDLDGFDFVDLSGNELTGRIPRAWATTSSGVAVLKVSDNRLRGCVPSALAGQASGSFAFNPQQDENGDNVTLPTCVEDATLSALAVSPGGLNETFAADDTDYTATVSPPTTSVTLTATPNDDGAEVTSVAGTAADGATPLTVTAGSGGWTVSGMTPGDNVVTVVVSADDLSTETYTVTVLQTWCGRAAAADTALIADCLTLLSLEDTLRGTATLNWDVATAIADWDGVTVGRPGGNLNQPKGGNGARPRRRFADRHDPGGAGRPVEPGGSAPRGQQPDGRSPGGVGQPVEPDDPAPGA